MAIWRAWGGSAEGFEEFDKWSRKSSKYDGEETEFRWRHYLQSPPDHIGFGSLVPFGGQNRRLAECVGTGGCRPQL